MTNAKNTGTPLSDEIKRIVHEEANNNPASEQCRILSKTDGYATVRLASDNRKLSNIPLIGDAPIDSQALIVYLNGEINSPIILASGSSDMNTILALGLGLFEIREDGQLWVELPNGISNIFKIESDGKLYVDIPSGASNDYSLGSDKILYYERRDY